MYTRVASWATFATPLPMWGVEGSEMDLLPNMVTDFRDTWSALRVVKSCRKDCPTAKVLLEAKAAALHPKQYQSSLSKLSTKEGG
jgi:hypothetical protein